jgi:hypothetical protein
MKANAATSTAAPTDSGNVCADRLTELAAIMAARIGARMPRMVA